MREHQRKYASKSHLHEPSAARSILDRSVFRGVSFVWRRWNPHMQPNTPHLQSSAPFCLCTKAAAFSACALALWPVAPWKGVAWQWRCKFDPLIRWPVRLRGGSALAALEARPDKTIKIMGMVRGEEGGWVYVGVDIRATSRCERVAPFSCWERWGQVYPRTQGTISLLESSVSRRAKPGSCWPSARRALGQHVM